MKKIFLHCGMHKTGTTAIQEHLKLNRHVLKKWNMVFPIEFQNGFSNHSTITFAMRRDSGCPTFYRYTDNRTVFELREAFLNEIEQSNCDIVIMSTENMIDLCFQVEKTFSLAKDFFEGFDVTPIVYIRRPDIFIESLWKEFLKIGITSDSPEKFYKNLPAPFKYYDMYIDFLEKLFGNRPVVKAYHREDVVKNFVSTIGINDTAGMNFSQEFKNISLSNMESFIAYRMSKLFDLPSRKADLMQDMHVVLKKSKYFSLNDNRSYFSSAFKKYILADTGNGLGYVAKKYCNAEEIFEKFDDKFSMEFTLAEESHIQLLEVLLSNIYKKYKYTN